MEILSSNDMPFPLSISMWAFMKKINFKASWVFTSNPLKHQLMLQVHFIVFFFCLTAPFARNMSVTVIVVK